MYKKAALIQRDIKDIETYPAWSTTHLASIRIKNGDTFTDCYVSAIVKRGRVQFSMMHEKGYPSEEKGVITKAITANWLSVKIPKA